jgi:hypothetical protein
MATVTLDTEGPGRASKRPLMVHSPRPMKVVTGTLAFDSSYPTGGESLADIFNMFTSLKLLLIDQPLTGAQTGKFIKVDYTNQKALLYTNASPAAEVADTSNQSAITDVRFVAIGY